MKLLSRQEEIVLLAIRQLKGNAYGVTIREYISERETFSTSNLKTTP